MTEVILEFWSPEGNYSSKVTLKCTETIKGDDDIDIFEQFYKKNNQIRYCNQHSFKFQDKAWEDKYQVWLQSPDYKQKSFNLYYGGGIVD